MRSIVILITILLLVSCERSDPGPVIEAPDKTLFDENGLFLMNEGNFGSGNGSVSFYSCDSGRIYNNVFYGANKRTPGDIPFSMTIRGDTGYIVVNNSGKIEVVNMNDMTVLKTVQGLTSPRYLLPVGGDTGYVSDLYSDSITLFDMKNLRITGYVDIGRSSEHMVKSGSKVYAASWSGGNMLTVINAHSHVVEKAIQVTREPQSMVIDKYGAIWVLCSGGFMQEEIPALVRINTASNEVDGLMKLKAGSYPTSLSINPAGDTLYYINNDIFRMSVEDSDLPVYPFIASGGRLFYRLEAGFENGNIFITDAVDYQSRGRLLRYSTSGAPRTASETGIIPGAMVYRYANKNRK